MRGEECKIAVYSDSPRLHLRDYRGSRPKHVREAVGDGLGRTPARDAAARLQKRCGDQADGSHCQEARGGRPPGQQPVGRVPRQGDVIDRHVLRLNYPGCFQDALIGSMARLTTSHSSG
jgi:hypothetical protein